MAKKRDAIAIGRIGRSLMHIYSDENRRPGLYKLVTIRSALAVHVTLAIACPRRELMLKTHATKLSTCLFGAARRAGNACMSLGS